MASWPLYVKGPLLYSGSLKIKLGTSVQFSEMADGRRKARRFGSNAPDILSCDLIMPKDRQDYFREYYERTLNMGLNWMAPSWLTTLGYTSCSVRFLGYPAMAGEGKIVVRYTAQFLIQLTALVSADTQWPET